MVCKNVIKGRLGGGKQYSNSCDSLFSFCFLFLSLYVPEIYCNVIATRFSKLSLFCFSCSMFRFFSGGIRSGGHRLVRSRDQQQQGGSLRGCISKEIGAHRAREGGPVDYAGLLSLRLKRTANATRLVKHSDLHPSGKIKKKVRLFQYHQVSIRVIQRGFICQKVVDSKNLSCGYYGTAKSAPTCALCSLLSSQQFYFDAHYILVCSF